MQTTDICQKILKIPSAAYRRNKTVKNIFIKATENTLK